MSVALPKPEAIAVVQRHVAEIAPTGVKVRFGTVGADSLLLREERDAIAGWSAVRTLQFTVGRDCARRALAELGYVSGGLLIDEDGLPIWPTGYVGSISHKRLLGAAVAARTSEHGALGLDIEADRIEECENELLRRVCITDAEVRGAEQLRVLAKSPATVLLAMKEAFFKAQYPKSRLQLEWDDVEVQVHSTWFLARCRRQNRQLSGVFAVVENWIVALCVDPVEVPTVSTKV